MATKEIELSNLIYRDTESPNSNSYEFTYNNTSYGGNTNNKWIGHYFETIPPDYVEQISKTSMAYFNFTLDREIKSLSISFRYSSIISGDGNNSSNLPIHICLYSQTGNPYFRRFSNFKTCYKWNSLTYGDYQGVGIFLYNNPYGKNILYSSTPTNNSYHKVTGNKDFTLSSSGSPAEFNFYELDNNGNIVKKSDPDNGGTYESLFPQYTNNGNTVIDGTHVYPIDKLIPSQQYTSFVPNSNGGTANVALTEITTSNPLPAGSYRIYIMGVPIFGFTSPSMNYQILQNGNNQSIKITDKITLTYEPTFVPNKTIFNTNYTLGEFIKSGKGNNNAYFQGLEARYQTYNNNKNLTTASITTPTYINNEGKVTTAAYETLNNIHNLANNIAYSSAYTVPSNLSSKTNYINTTVRNTAWTKVKNTVLSQYDKVPNLDPYYVVINLLGYNEKY